MRPANRRGTDRRWSRGRKRWRSSPRGRSRSPRGGTVDLARRAWRHVCIKTKAMSDIFIVHPDGHTSAELIPGARDPSTLTHREPGAIGGDPYGADIPAAAPNWEDEATC